MTDRSITTGRVLQVFTALFLFAGCGAQGSGLPDTPAQQGAPSDDPSDYSIDTTRNYTPVFSEPRWVVPSDGLPPEVSPMASNANVDIIFHGDRLFMAWRSAPYHFASSDTIMYLVSSLDGGTTWDYEGEVALNNDLREPRFISINDSLQLIFFEAGDNPVAFEPQRIWRTFRNSLGDWSPLEILIDEPEVPWDVKVRNGIAWMTSYLGNHYEEWGEGEIELYFKYSTDGLTWHLVDDAPYVYFGGVSEAAFEFDETGDLWAVTRNEDGDESGFGSHLCWAPQEALSAWECPAESDPERYDSPEMFRHGDDLYLVARRDIGGPFGEDDSLLDYSLRPKTTALYAIDREAHEIVHLVDLPGAGDNAFPSIHQTGPHTFLIANYTSPLDDPMITWIEGQTSNEGTDIYLLELRFVAD